MSKNVNSKLFRRNRERRGTACRNRGEQIAVERTKLPRTSGSLHFACASIAMLGWTRAPAFLLPCPPGSAQQSGRSWLSPRSGSHAGCASVRLEQCVASATNCRSSTSRPKAARRLINSTSRVEVAPLRLVSSDGVFILMNPQRVRHYTMATKQQLWFGSYLGCGVAPRWASPRIREC